MGPGRPRAASPGNHLEAWGPRGPGQAGGGGLAARRLRPGAPRPPRPGRAGGGAAGSGRGRAGRRPGSRAAAAAPRPGSDVGAARPSPVLPGRSPAGRRRRRRRHEEAVQPHEAAGQPDRGQGERRAGPPGVARAGVAVAGGGPASSARPAATGQAEAPPEAGGAQGRGSRWPRPEACSAAAWPPETGRAGRASPLLPGSLLPRGASPSWGPELPPRLSLTLGSGSPRAAAWAATRISGVSEAAGLGGCIPSLRVAPCCKTLTCKCLGAGDGGGASSQEARVISPADLPSEFQNALEGAARWCRL